MITGGLEEPQKPKDSSLPDLVESDRASSNSQALPGHKIRLLPDLSASTQEILARVQAEVTGGIAAKASMSPNNLNASTVSMENFLPLDATPNNAAHFQRPRMASEMFDKSKLKSAFASALIPKSKTLPSRPLQDSTHQSTAPADTSTSQNAALQLDNNPQPAAELSNAGPLPMKPEESTIEVIPYPAKSALLGLSQAGTASDSRPDAEEMQTPRPKMRMSHTYVLPSGEVVNSGKGLGRGRPGIKRGPRKPKPTSTPAETKPMSRKRKRPSVGSDIDLDPDSPSPSHAVSDSDDEYAPQDTQTRSGRHTQRPTTFVPPDSPSNKKPRLGESASVNADKLSIKRKVYKGKEQSALCEHCLRGYGPLQNAIVFCDGCNRCWHQKCHDPMIPRKLVLDPSSEWFCTDCVAVKEKAKEAVRIRKIQRPSVAAEELTAAPPSSADTTRKEYFTSLAKEKLVDLLMQASTLAPHLPLWQPPPAPPPPQPTTTPNPNPASSTREDAYPTPKNEPNEAEDDYDEYGDEHAKLYPKPGSGVHLPPESEDLHMMLEGPESRTFSHSLREGIVGTGM